MIMYERETKFYLTEDKSVILIITCDIKKEAKRNTKGKTNFQRDEKVRREVVDLRLRRVKFCVHRAILMYSA